MSGVAVCLSLCPELHSVGGKTELREGGGRETRWLLVDSTSQERVLTSSRAPPPFQELCFFPWPLLQPKVTESCVGSSH